MALKMEYIEENEFATVLDTDVEFMGTISTTEPELIKGKVSESNVHAKQLVIIEGGVMSGKIMSDVVSIAGKCEGDISIKESMTILKGGVVEGKVHTNALIVNDGGILNAECIMKKPVEDK